MIAIFAGLFGTCDIQLHNEVKKFVSLGNLANGKLPEVQSVGGFGAFMTSHSLAFVKLFGIVHWHCK